MKRLFLLLILGLSLSFTSNCPVRGQIVSSDVSSLEQQYNDYLVFVNDGYEAIRVAVFYNNGGEWQLITLLHIPGGYASSVPTGYDYITRFGYTTDRDDTFRICYSQETHLY